jgi:hypothetical protein
MAFAAAYLAVSAVIAQGATTSACSARDLIVADDVEDATITRGQQRLG